MLAVKVPWLGPGGPILAELGQKMEIRCIKGMYRLKLVSSEEFKGLIVCPTYLLLRLLPLITSADYVRLATVFAVSIGTHAQLSRVVFVQQLINESTGIYCSFT